MAIVKIPLCACIQLQYYQADTSLSSTTVELLTSFSNCIVYIYDEGWEWEYEYTSAEYFRLYSEKINCAIIADSWYQLRNKSARNPRFQEREPHPLSTRNTQVLINLYSIEVMSILTGMDVSNVMWEIVDLYNIPFNYVMIFMTSEEFASIDNTAVVTQFVRVSSPAVYIMILDQHEVNVIGFAHALLSASYLFRVTKLETRCIRQLHKIIHKDLQAAVAAISTLYLSWESCRFGKPLWLDPTFCAINVMAERWNITFVSQKDDVFTGPKIVEIKATFVIDAGYLPELSRTSDMSFDVVNYGILYSECGFVCVAQTSHIGLMAFVNAYDLLTWIVTATACIFLSATIALMTDQTGVSFWLKFLSATPVVLMLLVERFYGRGLLVRAASRQLVLVISLWAFGAMLIAIGFSGNLVSQLTSPSLPPCPQDMQQLARIQEYPVFTDTNEMSESSDDTIWRPLLHNHINDYVNSYGGFDGTLVRNLEQFGKTLTYVHDTVPLNPSNYNTTTQVLFAYVGSSDAVRAYGMWSITQSTKIRVLSGGKLPYFTTWAPFIVQRNFLAPVTRRFLADLFECGIWNFWADIYRAEQVNIDFKYNAYDTDEELQLRFLKKSKLAAIMRNFDPLLDEESPWSAMTLENLNAAVLLLGIGLLLSVCTMFNERCPWKFIGRAVLRKIMG